MSQPKIFGFAGSTYARTVLFAAAEKGVACTLEPLEFRSDAHRALHPFAKMPAMRHRDIQLFETAAIAVYLDEAFDGPSLLPATALDRATIWQWISAANAYFYPAFVGATLAEGGHDAGALEERGRSLTLLADALRGRSYLVGDALTLADLFVAPMLAFMFENGGAADDPLAGRSALRDWLDRVTSRESYGRLAAA